VTRGGHLYPVKALCALAAEHGIVSAIDGAQAVGMFDVNLHDLGCDLYANSLHKWFLGPSGTGFLYVRREFQERFHTLYYTDRETPPGAQKYETLGTYDLPTRAALGTALDFLNRIGIHNIEPRLRMLSDYLRDRLSAVPRVRLCTSRSYEVSSPGSTIFEVEGVSASAWPSLFLQESGMHVDDHTRDGHTGMRISTHYYNSLEEIDRLMDKLKELIQRFPGYI
jgi:selenocysteine lyase/cysteine desulfurase